MFHLFLAIVILAVLVGLGFGRPADDSPSARPALAKLALR
jgi:hypothetical protein